MKIILIHLVALSELIGSLWVVAEFNFNVSSMKGVDDIYFRMKRRRPSVRSPREEKIKTKQDVCLAILGSAFFDEHNVELVNPDHKTIRDEVEEHYPLIHLEHYRPRLSFDVMNPKFTNPYRIRDVTVHGNVVREYVFTCLAKKCSTRSIEQYFISPEYKADGSAKMVRFVFVLNEKKEMVVIAMAERSSVSPSPTDSTERVVVKECPSEESTMEQSTTEEENSSDNSSSW